MSRIALFIFALFASIFLTLASPVPVQNRELVEVDKRLTRTGRVRYFFGRPSTFDEADNAFDPLGYLVPTW